MNNTIYKYLRMLKFNDDEIVTLLEIAPVLEETSAEDHTPAPQVSIEKVCEGIGVDHVDVIDSTKETERFRELLLERLASNDLSVIIVRRPCIIALAKMKQN